MAAVWEFKEMRFTHEAKRSDVKALLTSMAETDRWELDRVRVYNDGRLGTPTPKDVPSRIVGVT